VFDQCVVAEPDRFVGSPRASFARTRFSGGRRRTRRPWRVRSLRRWTKFVNRSLKDEALIPDHRE